MTDWTEFRDAEAELTEEQRVAGEFLKASTSPFEHFLGETILVSDQNNASKFRAQFPAYWQKALRLAQRKVTL